MHVIQCQSTPHGSLLFWTTLNVLWILSLLYFILWPLMCLKAIVWPNKTCLSETDGKEGCKKKKAELFYNTCMSKKLCLVLHLGKWIGEKSAFSFWLKSTDRSFLQALPTEISVV